MADDGTIALYGAVKKMAEAMNAREAALDAKTSALHSAIARIEQIPAFLEQQTGQQIGAAVHQAIKEDFSQPIRAAVEGPLSDLNRATAAARHAAAEMAKESRFQNWTWIFVIFLLGFLFGGVAAYYFIERDIRNIYQQLDTIQQQIALEAPHAKSAPRSATKGHREH